MDEAELLPAPVKVVVAVPPVAPVAALLEVEELELRVTLVFPFPIRSEII
jgi:hypothetical protein